METYIPATCEPVAVVVLWSELATVPPTLLEVRVVATVDDVFKRIP